MKNEKQILEKDVKEIAKIIFVDSDFFVSVFSKEEKFKYSESQFDFLCEIELCKDKILM